MSDTALQTLFRTQAARLWRDYLPLRDAWLAAPDGPLPDALRQLVHTLKGSALGLDLHALAAACHALESAWHDGDSEAARGIARTLERLWQAQIEEGSGAVATEVDLESAVRDFFARTAGQLDMVANLHCRLAPAWQAEQELLWDVLPHLLRNALVHGQEPVATRLAAGKPERLRVWVRAHARPGRLCLLVADDGAGVRRERDEADLWSGRGQGVAAVRATVAGRGCLRWRSRAGQGGVARLSIFLS